MLVFCLRKVYNFYYKKTANFNKRKRVNDIIKTEYGE